MSNPNAEPQSRTNEPKGRLIKGLLIASALHSPLILGDRFDEVWSQKEDLAHMVKENAKGVVEKRTPEKEAYVKKLQEELKLGVPIDLGKFHLETEYLEGRGDMKRMKEAESILDQTEKELRVFKEGKEVLEVLQKIKDSGGAYTMSHSYLSSALIEKLANCHATEKYYSALIQRLYPELNFVYQRVKVGGVPHTRVLVEVDGKWHRMDWTNDVKTPMNDQDLESTVLYDEYDEIKNYAGLRAEGRFVGMPVKDKTPLRIAFSDDFLSNPLPRGIWLSDIKDIAQNASVNAGVGLGQGSVGRMETASQNQQGGLGVSSGNSIIRGAMQVELLGPDDVERNRKKTEASLERMRELVGLDEEAQKGLVTEILPGIPETCMVNIFLPIARKGFNHLISTCDVEPVSGLVSCKTSDEKDKALKAEMDRLEGLIPKYPECVSFFKSDTATRIDDDPEILRKLGIEIF